MDLYDATVYLGCNRTYQACITDEYYKFLVKKELTYKVKVDKQLVEIPVHKFRKEEYNDSK